MAGFLLEKSISGTLAVRVDFRFSICCCECPQFRYLFDDDFDLSRGERLGNIIGGPLADGLDGRIDRSVGGDHHDLGLGRMKLQIGDQIEAVFRSQPQVQKCDVEDPLLDFVDRIVEIADGHNGMTFDFQAHERWLCGCELHHRPRGSAIRFCPLPCSGSGRARNSLRLVSTAFGRATFPSRVSPHDPEI